MSVTGHDRDAGDGRTVRLFFALWPDVTMQSALADAVSSFTREIHGRPVPAGNFHITLSFLGSVPEREMGSVKHVGARFAQGFAARVNALEVTLDALEHWRKPQILCATASETSPSVVALAENLCSSLAAAGFTPDLKPFRAHATVVRKVGKPMRSVAIAPVIWRFSAFCLIGSRTLPQGSEYRVLESFALS